jgi:protein tyrosine phosphatase
MVHCRGGHGRTTVVVALVMVFLLEAASHFSSKPAPTSHDQASLLPVVMAKLYELHRSREFCRYRCDLPENEAQLEQMRRCEKDVRAAARKARSI